MVSHTSGLVRDLDVLELLGTDDAFERGGYGVQEIAALTRRDKGQISRVCRTLALTGLIARDPASKKYLLGHRMFAIALRTREAHLANLSQPFLLELVAQSEESAHLTVLRGGGVLTLRTELSQHTLRSGSLSGVTLPALRTASGRAILATLSDQELEAWWAEHGTFRTPPSEYPRQVEGAEIRRLRRQPGSIRSLSGLKRVTRGVRRAGYAVSVGELNPDIVDAAAVVVDGTGQAVAAISVGAIRERIGDRFETMGDAVTRVAQLLSRALSQNSQETVG
jgi:DNA-binding IclR family transcriptional regulator